MFSFNHHSVFISLLESLIDTDDCAISGRDMVDIFGGVYTEDDGCNAPETSEPTDETAYEPRQNTTLKLELSSDL